MSGHQEIWCQPADQTKRQFLVMFDDPQMDVAVFDSEEEARAFWEKANLNWTCYLLGTLPRYTHTPHPERKLDLGITKEWFERRAKAEADLEIGAGFSIVNPTDANIAQMELIAERSLPQWVQDEITRLRSELANARNAALEEAAKLIEEGFDRPGIAKKQDTCAHGKFGWEDCEQCAVVAIRALKAEGESRTPVDNSGGKRG